MDGIRFLLLSGLALIVVSLGLTMIFATNVARAMVRVSIALAILLVALNFVFLLFERKSGSDTNMILLPFWFFAIVFLLIAGGTYVSNKIGRNSNGTSLNLK